MPLQLSPQMHVGPCFGSGLFITMPTCSFPVRHLSQAYSFELSEGPIKVRKVITYEVKYGLLCKIMDALMVRGQFDKGINLFMQGLKSYAEHKD